MSPHENTNPAASLLRGEGDCLGPEQLELLLGQGGDAAIRQRFENHIRGCTACAAELDLLRSFLASTPSPDEEKDLSWVVGRLGDRSKTQVPAKPKTSWWQAWGSFSPISKVAVSAACLLLIVAGALELRQLRVGSAGVQDTGGAEVMRSTQVTLTGPSGDIAARPERLSWNPVPSAARYETAVEEVDGTVLWKGESLRPEIALPGFVQSQIVARKTLIWSVTAYDARGEKIAESPRERFRLMP